MDQPQSIAELQKLRECDRLGREHSILRREISDFTTNLVALTNRVNRIQTRIYDNQSRLQEIDIQLAASDVVSLTSKIGAPLSIGLLAQKIKLEDEIQNLKRQLFNAESDLNRTDSALSYATQRHDTLGAHMDSMGCNLGSFNFG